MCMKPCANTKQICSWQLWAYASKFPSLGKAFHFLVTISKLTPVLHIRAITSKDRGVIPQMCANLNRGYREGSGSNPPLLPSPWPLRSREAVPGGRELRGALLPSCARRPPATGMGSAGMRQLSDGSGGDATVSCPQARCRSTQLAFWELQEKEMGEELTPEGKLMLR